MYLGRVDGVQLLRLSKRLADLARDVTTSAGPSTLTPAEVTILGTVLRRPDSSVSELAAATGFAQSHVSTSVARLREADLLAARPDPADGRVTRLRLTARARRAIRQRASTPARAALLSELGDPAEAKTAERLLDELAALLLTGEPSSTQS
jgi:DNA-binding MarR family transcriptional regulator